MPESTLNSIRLDPDRLNRDHVLTVRGKDDKFKVIIADKDGFEIYVITWEQWIKNGLKY